MNRVLVIDDSKTVRDALRLTLQQAGYEVSEAVNGIEGLLKAGEHSWRIIICDVNMPELDGLGFLRALRTRDDLGAVSVAPVIMLTTESGREIRDSGRSLGASAWLVKPFQPEKLLRAVEKLSGVAFVV